MEAQIFLFTGKILWLSLCSAAVASAFAAVVVAPIMVYKSVRKHLWEWILVKELAKDGFSEADLRFAIAIPGGLPCGYDEFIEAAQRIKERGRVAKKMSKEREGR